ncbi:hypothetical protein ACFX15_019769 [Malus domestica]
MHSSCLSPYASMHNLHLHHLHLHHQELEWRFRHIAFFILVFAVKREDKEKDREKACYEILLLSTPMI